MTTWPTLFKLTATGATQTWTIAVNGTTITTTYGQAGGAMQQATIEVTAGKNAGRANATTAEEQAVADAQSKFDKQLKSGYHADRDAAEAGKVDESVIAGGIKPMLAKPLDGNEKKVVWPVASQPKLDGHRCIATIVDGEVTLWSRTRKPILSVPHIVDAISRLALPDGTVLDGELYNHGLADEFERLTSLLRKKEPAAGHEIIEYHIYDVASGGGTFEERAAQISGFGVEAPLVMVPTVVVENEAAMMEQQAVWLSDGYEGLMLRNLGSLYKNGRSSDLLKVKTFNDAEYEIVGVEEGIGKMAGCAIFVCVTPAGDEFRCKMAGSLDLLADMWKQRDTHIGAYLTVKFQGVTGDGIPRFPVGMRLRQDI